MGLRSGFDAINTALENQETGSSDGQDTNFIAWDGKESASKNKKIVRFITPQPYLVGIYSFLRCSDGKSRDFPNTEDLPNPRPDVIAGKIKKTIKHRQTGQEKEVDVRPRDESMALVAIRVEEPNPNGRGVVYKDKLRDYTINDEALLEELKELAKDGKVTLEDNVLKNVPEIGMVKQALGNFWKPLNGYFSRYGTIMDRDYEISRTGAGLDTDYTIIPCDPIDGFKEEDEVISHYELPLKVHPSLDTWLERMGDPERINHHLFGKDNKTSEGESTPSTQSSGGSSNSSSSAGETNESLQSELARVLGGQ